MAQQQAPPSPASRRASTQFTSPPQLPRRISQDSTTAKEPVRHPRPMTAAELHLELEKEQEAVVNRLTRELAALRQHSASVASNASSTSASSSAFEGAPLASHAVEQLGPGSHYTLSGPTHPTPSRPRRSSSSLSAQSINSQRGHAVTGTASAASIERARDAPGPRSRGNSLVLPSSGVTGGIAMPMPSRGSQVPSASPSPSAHHHQFFGGSGGGVMHAGVPPATLSTVPATSRLEEATAARAALEAARKENEMLAARVRELEARWKELNARNGGKGESEGTERGRRPVRQISLEKTGDSSG